MLVKYLLGSVGVFGMSGIGWYRVLDTGYLRDVSVCCTNLHIVFSLVVFDNGRGFSPVLKFPLYFLVLRLCLLLRFYFSSLFAAMLFSRGKWSFSQQFEH